MTVVEVVVVRLWSGAPLYKGSYENNFAARICCAAAICFFRRFGDVVLKWGSVCLDYASHNCFSARCRMGGREIDLSI